MQSRDVLEDELSPLAELVPVGKCNAYALLGSICLAILRVGVKLHVNK